ncbi:MAG TPA: hypothetical protein VFA93_01270 [Patescibacteria group bacterium]|nr:hypothetical protein [Patescibacteria group bacterium]
MNPSQQNLDPKLKEAYDRVMGTQIPQPGGTGSPSPVAQAQPQPQPQKAEEHPAPASSGPQPIININSNQPGAKPQQVQKAKGKGISPVVLITLGLLFFGGYTFIWLKVFKII